MTAPNHATTTGATTGPAEHTAPAGAVRRERLGAVLPVVLALALGPAVTLGLARFSYALVLPGMRADLHWTYTQAGGVNTVNALGYLLGAVAAAPVVGRFGA